MMGLLRWEYIIVSQESSVEVSLFAGKLIVYKEYTKNSLKNFLKLESEFSKITEFNISKQKLTVFLYIWLYKNITLCIMK